MTQNAPAAKRRAGLKTWLPALLFLLVIALSVFTTWQATMYCLDGDASSELVLANHLNEIGKPLSRDWYYSSELRVLNTQLIFAPLFSLFSDWHMVRFTGAIIMQAMLVLSFFYLGRQASLGAGALCLGGSLLLLPVCVTYGRNVLYQTFYMPHLIFGFLIVGLFLSVLQHLSARKKGRAALCFALLMALSFGTGLGGLRQIIITHGPLMLALLVLFYLDAKDQPVSKVVMAHLPGVLLVAAAIVAFLAGYLVNIRYLSTRYVFAEYHNLTTSLRETAELENILFGFLHSFGYRRDIRILSVLGILSASAVYSCICCLSRSIHLLTNADAEPHPFRRLISVFPICSLFVMMCVFLFIGNGWFYMLYLIPVTVWFIPMIAAHYDAMPESPALLKRADVCMLLCAALLAGNGLANTAYFATNGKVFPQKYDGQFYYDMQLAKKLEKPVAYLLENGYELGYSNFWTANPVTEISDGQIRMVNLLVNEHGRELVVHEWLMLKDTPHLQVEKTFLLLSAYYDRAYATMKFDYKGERVYDDGEFVIYHFDDPSILKDYTSWEFSTR